MSGSPTASMRLIGLLFWLAGGVVITFGWMGMAEIDYATGQLPYIVSGGAAGLGLIVVGSTLIIYAAVIDGAERGAQRTAELFKSALEDMEESDRLDRAETQQDSKAEDSEDRPALAEAGQEPK